MPVVCICVFVPLVCFLCASVWLTSDMPTAARKRARAATCDEAFVSRGRVVRSLLAEKTVNRQVLYKIIRQLRGDPELFANLTEDFIDAAADAIFESVQQTLMVGMQDPSPQLT